MLAPAVLLLLPVVALGRHDCRHCRDPRQHDQHRADYARAVFDEIASEVINADELADDYCDKYQNQATKEIQEQQQYILKSPLPDATDAELSVQIRNRILYITANSPTNPESNHTEIRELPTYVNTREAKYNHEQGTLKIVFPIKSATSCADNIDVDILTVPKF